MLRIGVHGYLTKTAALEDCRTLLGLHRAGEQITNPDHVAFLHALVLMHPAADIKVGWGVRSFEVGSDGYGKNCFWLTRVDGTRTDWSFTQCFKKPVTHRSKVLSALRAAVAYQVLEFRDTVSFPLTCPLSGVSVLPDTCHIDHEIPFKLLIDQFCALEGIELDCVALAPHADGDTSNRLAGRELQTRWCAFHAANAILRAVDAGANLRRGTT